MKKILFSTTVVLFFICLQTQAQQAKALDYIQKYKDIAIAEMQRSGVPAAITLAQGMLESAYGESDLCKQSNNHFGIKCSNWTGDKVYHDDDVKHECFRAYPDAAASYKDHSDFLKSRPWYASLFTLAPTDVEGWAYGLKKAGYATEKDYPQRLLGLINRYNLNQYTLAGLQSAKTTDIADVKKNASSNEPEQTFTVTKENFASEKNSEIIVLSKSKHQQKENTPADTSSQQENEVVILSTPAAENKTTVQSVSNYPKGIFSINHTKVIYAHAGTSLLMLAMEHHIDLSRLVEYNELKENDILQKDDLIFLEKKQKKGEKDFHVVTANETLHDICQKEGVRMDCILTYNNFNKNLQPAVGNKVYLKAQAFTAAKTSMASTNNSASKNSL